MNDQQRVMVAGGILAGAFLARRVTRSDSFDFQDRSVLITGGSRGLGLVIARQLAGEGANLTLVSRNVQDLELAKKELLDRGASVQIVAADVRDQNDARRAVEQAIYRFGSLDVLINNAGVMKVGPLEHMQMEDFQDAFDTHVWGPLYTTLAVLPQMRAQGGGRIVNISSIGGKIAVPHMLPYSTSKFALSGLSDGMRSELRKDGILVTSVYPGLMRTGSHVNASFKGRSQEEYAWFSILAGLPLFSINATRAANQIIQACRQGRSELIVTTQAKVAVIAQTLAQGLVARILALVNTLLPKPNTANGKPIPSMNDREKTGWDSMSKWSPSALTHLADKAIEENNEHRAS